MRELQAASQPLFAPRCPISGDPNPTNWGLRDDGSLVLFDWERFGYGTPVLDLAITIPGLGDGATFRRVAGRYLGDRRAVDGPLCPAGERLSREIAIAKVWSVVEFLSNYAEGRLARIGTIDWLVRLFPGWLQAVSGADRYGPPR